MNDDEEDQQEEQADRGCPGHRSHHFRRDGSTAALTISAGVGTLGYATQTISGGTVVAVNYTLGNGANPATIDEVLVKIKDPNTVNGALPVVPKATI